MFKKNIKLFLIIPSFFSLLFSSDVFSQNEPIEIPSTNIDNFRISADSEYIVFNDIDSNQILSRLSVQINGESQPQLIIDNIIEDNFHIDPDDNRVYSFIDRSATNPFNSVLSSSIDGNTSNILSTGNPDDISITNFNRFSSTFNGGTDLYLFSVNDEGLYSIANDGSSPATLLSTNLNDFDEVESFRISRNRQTVIYSVRNNAQLRQIYSVPLDGSSSPILLVELPEFTRIDGNFLFSQDDTRAVFISETSEENGSKTLQLNSVKIDGTSDITPLSLAINSERPNINHRITNENIVLFSTRDRLNNFSQLFSVVIDGSEDPVLLDTGLDIGRFTSVTDGDFVVYNIENPQTFDPSAANGLISIDRNDNIFITRIDGSSEPQILIDNTDPDQLLRSILPRFLITDDEKFTFFISRNSEFIFGFDPTNTPQLYRSTNSGSFSTQRININSSNVSDFQLNESQTRIFYTAELDNSGLTELFQSELDGSNPIKISFPEHGDILRFDLSNDNNYAVYEARATGSEFVKLYTVKLINTVQEPFCFPIQTKDKTFVTICL